MYDLVYLVIIFMTSTIELKHFHLLLYYSTGFQECGKVTQVRLAVWGHTAQFKGFGYVDFGNEESALIAVKKNGKLSLSGRPLLIDFDTNEQKGSFKRNEWISKNKSSRDSTEVGSKTHELGNKSDEDDQE